MAYETYTTEAIVCGSHMRGEHDGTIRLFTKDAGMVYARAGGVRAGRSKLRYALQDFSHIHVSLVRGRHEWRIIGAISVGNFYYQATDRTARATLLLSMRSVRRFVQGAGVHPELFLLVLDGMRSFASGERAPMGEQVFMIRLLHELGYVAGSSVCAPVLSASTFRAALDACQEKQDLSVAMGGIIEKALLVSQL